MKKFLKIISTILTVTIIIYLVGPRPEKPTYNSTLPTLPSSSTDLETYVKKLDAGHKIKPGNGAEIVWTDSSKKKTKIVVLYLHGFSASHEEGSPIHREFAKRFGANLYLARLYGHGIDTTDALADFTAEKYWESAKDAYAVAKQLGDEVIIMSTSTGGTLALKLAATYPEIKALINFSPNIAINDPAAFITNNPWGLQITRLVMGGNYRTSKVDTAEAAKYWYYTYRCEAIPALEELIETSMTKDTFEKVKCPVLTVYYYKDEQHQDQTVKVSAMKTMNDELGTPANRKEMVPIPNAANHVIANPLKSKDVKSVENACIAFAENVLKLDPLAKK
ncbi:alpha/beta hydrolase [Solitalea koreensis]|uniref:Esterase/lipase n=1 Tax=Solitalea koreensis TaxID=543615 RepID=A0A521AKB4_9SPHI|nr:alpha/beta fold hydrolase [Solitalea koreensis]SMO35238.1 Esterase/lipase [Solitalea koreensis]